MKRYCQYLSIIDYWSIGAHIGSPPNSGGCFEYLIVGPEIVYDIAQDRTFVSQSPEQLGSFHICSPGVGDG